MRRIAIHGVPRSGTTWVGALLDSCPVVRYANQPLFSYAFKDRLNLSSSGKDIKQFFEDLAISSDPFIDQTLQKEKGAIPLFHKDNIEAICYKEARYHHLIPHLLREDPELAMFFIIRNPLSVMASWVKAPKEFDHVHMDLSEEWRKAEKKNMNKPEEWYGFDKWKEFALMAMEMSDLYPERCRIIEYDQLLQDTEAVVMSCFEFCGIPYTPQTRAFINESRSRDMRTDAYSVFRVKQDDRKWSSTLPLEIIQAIELELKGTSLSRYLDDGGL